MRPLLILLFITFPGSQCFPAFEQTDYGVRSMAMGGAFCGLSDDCEGIPVNPAGLPQMTSTQLSAFYTRLYSMDEQVHSSISCGQPFALGTSGVLLSTFGRAPYQEFVLVLAYGCPFNRISLGGSLRLMRLQITDYGSANSLGVDLGLLGQISKQLNVGVSIRNLNSPQMAGDDLPTSLTAGFAISPAQGLILCCDAYKEARYALETRLGGEYNLGSALVLRSGFTTGACSFFTWGLGYRLGEFELGYAGKSHAALGLTHGLSVLVSLGPRSSLRLSPFGDSSR